MFLCCFTLGSGKYSCVDCQATFDKAPKLIFHHQHCGKPPIIDVKVAVSSTDNNEGNVTEKNDSSAIKQNTLQPKPHL